MRHGSLFSGIGGFDLASDWMGWENVFHCEWNPFGQKVLKHYWPNAKSYEDITKTDFTIHRGKIDILTGGFPCQPYSSAGKRLGKEDDRHLWPEMLRAIREIQPSWVVGENVRGLTNWNGGLVFNEVQSDLEIEGYEVLPFLLPACAVNAPHRRDRIWFIAYSNNNDRGCSTSNINEKGEHIFSKSTRFSKIGDASNPEKFRPILRNRQNSREFSKTYSIKQFYGTKQWETFPTVSPICTRNDGFSNRLDTITFPKWRSESIKAGGNAIVPQVAHQIFKAIDEYETINS
jgi:DNA (cytosine-5)-methyltransferase 1